MRRFSGFTLIEVMVTVAIIAILAAVAIPSYGEYVRRSRVTEGLSALAGTRIRMEQFFQDNRTYVGACSAGTVAPAPTSDNFTYVCTLNPSTYTITATGAGTLAGFSYAVNETNQRSTTMSSPSTWASNPNCWVTKKDGSC